MWFWDSRAARMRLLVFGVVLAATVVKLILAATTQGTNDVRTFGIALTTATTGNSVTVMEV